MKTIRTISFLCTVIILHLGVNKLLNSGIHHCDNNHKVFQQHVLAKQFNGLAQILAQFSQAVDFYFPIGCRRIVS